jgi:hypothetical protein
MLSRACMSVGESIPSFIASSTTPVTYHIGEASFIASSKGGQARKDLAVNFLCVIVILELPLLARTGCQNAPPNGEHGLRSA